MPATVAANASNDVQGISCAICCEKKKPRRLHMLCGVCESSDKKSCLECWAKLLHNCDEIECVALHLKCPWCRTLMHPSELNASALSGSNAFNRVAAKLRYEHLCNLLHEREDNLDMLNHAVDAISGQSNLAVDVSSTAAHKTAKSSKSITERRLFPQCIRWLHTLPPSVPTSQRPQKHRARSHRLSTHCIRAGRRRRRRTRTSRRISRWTRFINLVPQKCIWLHKNASS